MYFKISLKIELVIMVNAFLSLKTEHVFKPNFIEIYSQIPILLKINEDSLYKMYTKILKILNYNNNSILKL